MKRILLTLVCLAALPGAAAAQFGNLAIFADNQGLGCNITDAGPGIIHAYVFHVNAADGSTASEFKVVQTGTLSYVGESAAPNMVTIGNSQTDLSIGYPACLSGSFLILDVSYFGSGTSPACSRIQIATADGQVAPLIAACTFLVYEVTNNGQSIVNPDGNCQCNVATEESTWGKVKSLYR